MLSFGEQKRLNGIKSKTLAGLVAEVSHADKQWVLDIVRREKAKLSQDTLRKAAAEGYDTTDIHSVA